MANNTHDLELTVLTTVNRSLYRSESPPHLEAFILKNAFNRRVFSVRGKLGLEDDSEGTVSDNFTLSVLHFTSFARLTVLHFLADDLWWCD